MLLINFFKSVIQLPLTLSIFESTENILKLQYTIIFYNGFMHSHATPKHKNIQCPHQKTLTSKYFIFLAFLIATESNL